jgi:Flp pilus assembly protein TadD/ADP-heptose:LPS heptosyltransferase
VRADVTVEPAISRGDPRVYKMHDSTMFNQQNLSANEDPTLATRAPQTSTDGGEQQDADTFRSDANAISALQIGAIESQKGNITEAEIAYRRALKLKPDFAEALNNLGILLAATKRFVDAEAAYRRALEIKPDFVEVLNNLGILLWELKRFVEAEAIYCRVLEIKPDFVEAHNNLGNLLRDAGRVVEAEVVYRRALEAKPGSVEVQNNLGKLLKEIGRPIEAEVAFRRALELKSDFADARHNLACFLLGSGRYSEAWEHYESRYDPSIKGGVAVAPNHLPFPHWQGERLVNKSLVIWAEEGFGDQIQFARYIPLLKRRGASRIILVCNDALKPLLETVDGVDAVLTNPNTVPLHDYWSLFMSLPLHFATTVQTIPARVPYVFPLRDRTERWRKMLPSDGLRVGLVWKGSAAHSNDASRSLPALSALSTLWSVPGVTFISLQKGQGEGEAIRPPAGQPLIPLGQDIRDFADTAAIVSQLDLTICVDTSVAHVAGALGKPCWVMLPSVRTDWRWLQVRTDSPWYPKGMRLFRQTKFDDWTEVIEEVTAALKSWAMTHPRAKSKAKLGVD